MSLWSSSSAHTCREREAEALTHTHTHTSIKITITITHTLSPAVSCSQTCTESHAVSMDEHVSEHMPSVSSLSVFRAASLLSLFGMDLFFSLSPPSCFYISLFPASYTKSLLLCWRCGHVCRCIYMFTASFAGERLWNREQEAGSGRPHRAAEHFNLAPLIFPWHRA